MAEVVDLAGRQSKKAAVPNAELIAFLTELLDSAKTGHLQQVAAVWVDHTGVPGDGYSPGGHELELYPIIAGLEVCKATLLSSIVGPR
jgi:hypothetical protein